MLRSAAKPNRQEVRHARNDALLSPRVLEQIVESIPEDAALCVAPRAVDRIAARRARNAGRRHRRREHQPAAADAQPAVRHHPGDTVRSELASRRCTQSQHPDAPARVPGQGRHCAGHLVPQSYRRILGRSQDDDSRLRAPRAGRARCSGLAACDPEVRGRADAEAGTRLGPPEFVAAAGTD